MIPLQLVPWRLIALSAVVAALLTVASVWRIQRDQAREQLLEARTETAENLAAAERDARVRIQAAQAAAAAERAAIEAQGRAAAERAAGVGAAAQAKALEWRRRYEAAQADAPSCAAWSRQPIGCPVGP